MWYRGNDKPPKAGTEKTVRISPASMSREIESIFPKHIEQMPEEGGPTPSWESTQMFIFRTSKLLA